MIGWSGLRIGLKMGAVSVPVGVYWSVRVPPGLRTVPPG